MSTTTTRQSRTLASAGVLGLAVALAATLAPSAQAAPASDGPQLTPAQQALVRQTLLNEGADATAAQEISSDPDLANQVAIPENTTFEVEGSDAGIAPEPETAHPNAIGSTCSGHSGWVRRRQYFNDVVGIHLAYTQLRTDFCYNNRRVTYAHSTPSHHTYPVGVAATVWHGWGPLSEGFYLYNKHLPNSGAKASIQGTFSSCILHYGCLGSMTSTQRTFAHYNGTWNTSGNTGS